MVRREEKVSIDIDFIYYLIFPFFAHNSSMHDVLKNTKFGKNVSVFGLK